MTRIKKHNLTLWLIIVSFLFFALSPTSIALAKPDESSMPTVNSQQENQASSQENNNSNIGEGQEKNKDNKQSEGNPNQGKNSQPGNNGKGNSNGNGNPDGNASSDKDKNRGNLNPDNSNKERRGMADTASPIMGAIGRGTKDAAEMLKSIPAKIVPAAIEAAEYLGAALAEKLKAIAGFIQGIFGTASPAMVSESSGATKG